MSRIRPGMWPMTANDRTGNVIRRIHCQERPGIRRKWQSHTMNDEEGARSIVITPGHVRSTGWIFQAWASSMSECSAAA